MRRPSSGLTRVRRGVVPGLVALGVALLVLAGCATTPAARPTPAPAASSAPTAAPAAPPPAESGAAAVASEEKAIADFYRGKTIRIIVGTAAGGGYDTYSRNIARHIGRYIPGNPTVIVENMPGAGSILAGNHVYNVAPRDGTIIGNLYGELVLNQLFGASGVQYDMSKFQYVGVPTPEHYVMVVHKRAGITKFEELLGPSGKQVVVGAIAGSTVENAATILREVLGANLKIVSGYQGTSNIRLALQGGEVDGFFNTWESTKITSRDEVDGGEWVILTQLTDKPLDDLPGNVPTIFETVRDDEQRQMLLLGVTYPNFFAKLYVTAPDVPAERVATLEAAFMRTMQDAEFLADVEKSRLEIAPISGGQTRKLVLDTLNIPADIKARLQPLIKLG